MRRAWLTIRSAILWALSLLHFGISVPILVVLAFIFDPRKHDWLQRAFCRRIIFFAGARVKPVASPGFDPKRTCIFISNHVNLFDPFALYCAIPQFTRGWELESHFRIPIYGLLMKRFGNVPVPDVRRSSDLKRLWRLTKDAIDGGMSLIVFPEGKRTRDGCVGEFQLGAFRLAQQLNIPLVPVSLVGSFSTTPSTFRTCRNTQSRPYATESTPSSAPRLPQRSLVPTDPRSSASKRLPRIEGL